MYKVLLCSKTNLNDYMQKGYDVINNFYMGKSAVIISGNLDTKTYYIKNFPKDLIINGEDNNRLEFDIGANEKKEGGNILFKKKESMNNSYVVKPLDTIKSICEKLNIDENSLITSNNLKNKQLFIGQILKIED